MKNLNSVTGKYGEDLATELLENKGYTILERNWRNKFGEIDIIAKKDGILIFTEVKTKVGVAFGSPEEMAGPQKLYKVRHMATIYMKGVELPCRIDVVAIVLNEDNTVSRITHYENVQ